MQEDGILPIQFHHPEFDDIGFVGLESETDRVRLDGKFAMATVSEDRQSNRAGSTIISERLDRRANGPSRKQDVVDKNQLQIVDRKTDVAALNSRFDPSKIVIVTVQCDIQGAEGNLTTHFGVEGPLESLGERDSMGVDSNKREARGIPDDRENLPRDVHNRFIDLISIGQDFRHRV